MAKILVVDDEDGIRRVLRQLLEYEGHEVRTAASGGAALDLFPTFDPDLTFLDVKMAHLDGLEVLVRLRELDPEALVVKIGRASCRERVWVWGVEVSGKKERTKLGRVRQVERADRRAI